MSLWRIQDKCYLYFLYESYRAKKKIWGSSCHMWLLHLTVDKAFILTQIFFQLKSAVFTCNSTHGVTCSKNSSIYCVIITKTAAVHIFDINKCKLSNGEVLNNLLKFIFSFYSCFVATEVSFCNCDIFSSVSCALWQWNKSYAAAGTEQTFFLPFSNGKLA